MTSSSPSSTERSRCSGGGSVVDRLGAGAYFGEMSLLDDGPRTATVVTTGPATLLAIDRATFRTVLQSSPQVAITLLGTLAGRLRERPG